MIYSVLVEYPSELYFADNDLDSQIREAAHVECDATGMGFGLRDLSFSYPSEKDARDAEFRFRSVSDKIEVTIFETPFEN